MLKILHIIDKFSGSGPSRAMITAAKYASTLELTQQHRVVSLKSAVNPIVLIQAKQAGMTVLKQPGRDRILCEIENTDIVHVHFWNNPAIYKLMYSELPAMRLLLWFHILGNHPPQIITRELIDYTDFALATSPCTLKLPVFKKLPELTRLEKTGSVYSTTDFDRLSKIRSQPHDNFNVGYIGSVNFAKMHPDFVSMSSRVDISNVRFIVCGGISSELRQQALQLGVSERFDFRGYVENIRSVFEILDVFGYPLCKDTYATSELVLQEAMYAGVPPVVFPYGGIRCLVENNKNGLVVHSESEYKQAIEYLYNNPEERTRLSCGAREHARVMFDGRNTAKQLDLIYKLLMDMPKRQRKWSVSTLAGLNEDLDTVPKQPSPAQLFTQALGDAGSQFALSMTAQSIEELLAADQKIANSSLLLSGGEGGIFHYRNYYPNDGYLRLWSGLVLQQQGRQAKAFSEFTAAINLGCKHWRVKNYLTKAIERKKILLKCKACYVCNNNCWIDEHIIEPVALDRLRL